MLVIVCVVVVVVNIQDYTVYIRVIVSECCNILVFVFVVFCTSFQSTKIMVFKYTLLGVSIQGHLAC